MIEYKVENLQKESEKLSRLNPTSASIESDFIMSTIETAFNNLEYYTEYLETTGH